MPRTAQAGARHTVNDIFSRPVFARLRRLCLALPEVSETSSWGHPNFRANRRTFCTFEMVKGRPSIAFRLKPALRARARRMLAGFVTPYGRGQWVSVWLDGRVNWKIVTALVEHSYREIAGERLIRQLRSRRT